MTVPGLGSWIERRARRAPEASALRGPEGELSNEDLARRIRSFAAHLVERGVAPGERIAFHGVNHPAGLVSLFATTAIGAVWVPIHPARREDEVRSVLADAAPRVLVRAEPETHPEAGIPEITADELDALDATRPLPERGVRGDDLAILAYTSGTTGAPKGVMLTESNLLWNVVQMVAACGLTTSDVAIAAAPMTRIGGLGVTVLPTLFAGGTIVVPPAVDGSSVLRTIEHDRVTVLFANPDLLDAMVRAPEWPAADLSGVRTGVVGGGLVPGPLLHSYLDRGVRLRHGYGLTEAAPVVSLLDDHEAAERTSTVGRPLPFVDVRVVRPDGSDCAPDEVGEWWIRGPNVCPGYWGLPPVVDDDGWFPTGDLGSVDADGYLTFLDRVSSALMIEGETVYPTVVEGLLYGTAGIADAAVGEAGGTLVAAVVTTGDAAIDEVSMLAALRDALPAAAVPSEVRIVDAIPRNAAGKVRRDELRMLLTDP